MNMRVKPKKLMILTHQTNMMVHIWNFMIRTDNNIDHGMGKMIHMEIVANDSGSQLENNDGLFLQ